MIKHRYFIYLKSMTVWLYPIAWMSLIFLSSATPYDQQDLKPTLLSQLPLHKVEPFVDKIRFTYHQTEISVAHLGMESFVEFFIRKGAHLFVFFVLTLLLMNAFRRTTSLKYQNVFLFSLIISVAYAFIDEWHQSITPNRTPYIGDVLIDSTGSMMAVLTVCLVVFVKEKSKKRKREKLSSYKPKT